jgi:hypothetical protein
VKRVISLALRSEQFGSFYKRSADKRKTDVVKGQCIKKNQHYMLLLLSITISSFIMIPASFKTLTTTAFEQESHLVDFIKVAPNKGGNRCLERITICCINGLIRSSI